MSDTTIEEFLERIEPCWSRATSYWPDRWSEASPAHGQCLVTTLVARDVFGGSIIHGEKHEIDHYWNLLPDACEFDFTIAQFGRGPHPQTILAITPPTHPKWKRRGMYSRYPLLPESHFTDLNKDGDLERRYMLLKRRYAFRELFPHQTGFKPFGEYTWG